MRGRDARARETAAAAPRKVMATATAATAATTERVVLLLLRPREQRSGWAASLMGAPLTDSRGGRGGVIAWLGRGLCGATPSSMHTLEEYYAYYYYYY